MNPNPVCKSESLVLVRHVIWDDHVQDFTSGIRNNYLILCKKLLMKNRVANRLVRSAYLVCSKIFFWGFGKETTA